MSASNPFPVVVGPADRSRWNEMLKIAPLIIVLLYFRSRQPAPVTQLELAENLLIDRKTAAKYCRQLSARSFIAQVSERDGYALTDGSTAFFEMWGINGHISLKESLIKDLRLNEKKEGKKDVGIFWTHAQTLTAEQIIAESGRLFGNAVTVFGLERCDPLMVLSVFAHAYDQRDRLKAPAVFAYRRLQRNEKPDKKYLADPEAFLPNEFLHALGLQELRVVEVVAVDEPEEAVVETATETEAQSILKQLGNSDPRLGAVTQKWHTATVADNKLILAVGSQEECDYYSDRFLTTINRALVGIRNSLTAQFVVAMETGVA